MSEINHEPDMITVVLDWLGRDTFPKRAVDIITGGRCYAVFQGDLMTDVKHYRNKLHGCEEELSRTKERLVEAVAQAESLHHGICDLLNDASGRVSHYEVSGNAVNRLEDLVKSKEVQRVLNMNMIEEKV